MISCDPISRRWAVHCDVCKKLQDGRLVELGWSTVEINKQFWKRCRPFLEPPKTMKQARKLLCWMVMEAVAGKDRKLGLILHISTLRLSRSRRTPLTSALHAWCSSGTPVPGAALAAPQRARGRCSFKVQLTQLQRLALAGSDSLPLALAAAAGAGSRSISLAQLY